MVAAVAASSARRIRAKPAAAATKPKLAGSGELAPRRRGVVASRAGAPPQRYPLRAGGEGGAGRSRGGGEEEGGRSGAAPGLGRGAGAGRATRAESFAGRRQRVGLATGR
ncbi:hypothetical protein NL676_023576 [Syzygium grande]|nr:hypothetical protein NL676_023576 [Syzygium grande]